MEDFKRQVGLKIREARKIKGLTQKELGLRLNVSESAINKYETGKVNPSIGALHNIANALGAKLNMSFKFE